MTDENEVENAETIDEAAETATDAEAPDEPTYEIIDGDVDGNKVKGVRAIENGNILFTVSEDFNNDQIDQVFNLGNKFFKDGIQFASGQQEQRAAQGLAALGVTPRIIKQFYDIAVMMEEEAAAKSAATEGDAPKIEEAA